MGGDTSNIRCERTCDVSSCAEKQKAARQHSPSRKAGDYTQSTWIDIESFRRIDNLPRKWWRKSTLLCLLFAYRCCSASLLCSNCFTRSLCPPPLPALACLPGQSTRLMLSTFLKIATVYAFLSQSIAHAAPQASSSSSSNGSSGSGSGSSNSTGASSTNTTRPLGTRAHHGLGQDWMQKNSLYIGFLPDWSR